MFVASATSHPVKHMKTSCTAHAVTAATNTRYSCDAGLAFSQATTVIRQSPAISFKYSFWFSAWRQKGKKIEHYLSLGWIRDKNQFPSIRATKQAKCFLLVLPSWNVDSIRCILWRLCHGCPCVGPINLKGTKVLWTHQTKVIQNPYPIIIQILQQTCHPPKMSFVFKYATLLSVNRSTSLPLRVMAIWYMYASVELYRPFSSSWNGEM